jgi:hypothetical protein
MNHRTVVFKALCLSLLATNIVGGPCIAVENDGPRPLWFNQYDLPESAGPGQVTIDQDYPLNAVFTRFYKNLEISKEQGLQTIGTTINFQVAPDGKISISQPRGNDTDKQVWCTFLDAAVMASSVPAKIPPKYKVWFDENGTSANLFFELQPKLKEAAKGAERIEQIHSQLPENKKNLVVIRAIPKQILESYPGLFTAEEFDETSNFRTLDPSKASLQIIESLRKPWCEILSTTTEVSKQDIQKLREKIDKEFSSVISSIETPT